MSSAGEQPDDRELARRARAGDRGAFGQLVDLYQGPVLRFLLLRCGNRHDAEDVAQASFVAAFRALPRYDDRHSFYTWIFTIARRQCIDLLRRRRDHRPLDAAPEPAVDAILPASDEADNLWTAARAHLNINQFQALWMVYREDRSIEEAAGALGWTRVRVKVTLHRARERLKALLTPLTPALPLTPPSRHVMGAFLPPSQKI